MNDNDRGLYKPAPAAGSMPCPKCKTGVMVATSKNPKVSACGKCGHTATRVVLK